MIKKFYQCTKATILVNGPTFKGGRLSMTSISKWHMIKKNGHQWANGTRLEKSNTFMSRMSRRDD